MQKTYTHIVIGLMILTFAVGPASGIETTVGTPESKVIGAAADPDANELSLNGGLATANCKGTPIVAMACTVTGTSFIEICVEIDGEAAGFIPISGQVCTAVAGAVALAGSASAIEYDLEAIATVNEFKEPQEYDTDQE